MGKSKTYASVLEMMEGIQPDSELREEIAAEIESRKLVTRLVAIRVAKGLSQRDVADRMQCSQSRLSKLENTPDNNIKLGDLRRYAEAVGCDFAHGIIPDGPDTAEKIKSHALAIKKHLDDLATFAPSFSPS